MDKLLRQRQIEALEKSIEKWDGIVAGTVEDQAGGNCECCKQFKFCINCPVAHYVSNTGCDGTPYHKFSLCYGFTFLADITDSSHNDFIECAEAERDFLKEVLADLKAKGKKND